MGTRLAGRIDWTFMLAAALAIAAFVLAVVFYWRPAAGEALNPRWWQWAVTGALFFAAVGVAYHRHRTRSRAALHAELAAQRQTMATDPPGDAQSPRIDPPSTGTPGPNRYQSITDSEPADDGASARRAGARSPEGRDSRRGSDPAA